MKKQHLQESYPRQVHQGACLGSPHTGYGGVCNVYAEQGVRGGGMERVRDF